MAESPPPDLRDPVAVDTRSGLVVQGLAVDYGYAHAVAGVDLIAPRGAVTAVVGPNGAGKSSIVNAIYGGVRARGRILVDDEDISGLRPTVRARSGIALVPQGRQLFPRLTVLENLEVMASMLRAPRGAIGEALDRFERLGERRRALAGVLSGGEQQMLAIARALLTTPSVLLCDEMRTGLAPLIVEEITRVLTELARGGAVVVIAEPSLGLLVRHVDRGYVIVRGEVAASSEAGGAALDGIYQEALLATEQ